MDGCEGWCPAGDQGWVTANFQERPTHGRTTRTGKLNQRSGVEDRLGVGGDHHKGEQRVVLLVGKDG